MNDIFSVYKELFYLYPGIPLYFFGIVFIAGIFYTFFMGGETTYSGRITGYLNAAGREDLFFVKAGINITANQYKLALFLTAILIFLVRGLNAVLSGEYTGIIGAAVLPIAAVYFLYPRRHLYKGIKSIFIIAIDRIAKKRSRELDYELYNSVTMLKNLAIAQEKSPLSFDIMLERLMDCAKKLKPIYQKTLSLYRSDGMVISMKYFSEAIGTKNARSFALILEKMDKINPTELKNQVLSFQEAISEEMFTGGLEKAEWRGTVIYVLATAVSFVCLINFIFVSVLTDTLGMLGELF